MVIVDDEFRFTCIWQRCTLHALTMVHFYNVINNASADHFHFIKKKKLLIAVCFNNLLSSLE